MTPDTATGQRDDADPSGATTPAQGTEAEATVGDGSDTKVPPRARRRLVVLNLGEHDPRTVATAIDVLLDTVIRPGSRFGDVLAVLADQLDDPDRLEQALLEVETARARRGLDDAFAEILAERVRTQRWDESRYLREWRKYPDPETGLPYALPYHWERSAGRLADDGLPWNEVADQIQDTLTGPGARTHAAVLRGCRRTLKRLQARAERRAELEGHEQR